MGSQHIPAVGAIVVLIKCEMYELDFYQDRMEMVWDTLLLR